MPNVVTLSFALIAFAANSFFCRFALAQGAIDPGSFTLIRIFSGAITLAVLLTIRGGFQWTFLREAHSRYAGVSLILYAMCFSYAYVQLSTGTGALILFGTVQMALIAYHVISGNPVSRIEKIGIAMALVGFVILMLPSAQSPDVLSAVLMIVAGIAWAIFTVLGKKSGVPSVAITQGFVMASIMGLVISPLLLMDANISTQGVIWALLSGILASALGYIIWYQVLKKISILTASIAQLSVPMIAYLAGGLLLGESITATAVFASSCILGGIAMIFLTQSK